MAEPETNLPWPGSVDTGFSLYPADTKTMRERRASLRASKMVRVETSWTDEKGIAHIAGAMIEDSSVDGVGIRIRTPVQVGQKIEVRTHREQFSGLVMNCHQNGTEYFIGIKRDKVPVLASK